MTAKRLILIPYYFLIVNRFFIYFSENWNKLLNTLKSSRFLLNTHIVFCNK